EHIIIRTTFSSGILPVMADSGLIEQLLMNLIVNSRDAMPRGGQLLLQTADIIIDEIAAEAQPQRRAGRFVQLTVSDTGSGIPPEHLGRIFEPFYTTKEAGKGTGLGLATVFGIVQQHRGWIEVDSQLGAGTVFRVFLPRTMNDASPAGDVKGPGNEMVGGSESILLVEDEQLVRRMMKDLLERYGYRVLPLENGVKAYDYYKLCQPKIDLLITDMVMPGGMTGRELIDLLRAEQPGLKVLLCSGYADEFAGAALPGPDVIDFLPKPFEAGTLLTRVRERLDAC
ncbi:MAG TPA: ATP-binding protein, partial [Opitutus sp.]|nr:ATP-binding protein [Opitutus sp.]